jgi:hypothetical protein
MISRFINPPKVCTPTRNDRPSTSPASPRPTSSAFSARGQRQIDHPGSHYLRPYGEIERLNKKDDKNYNMMNLKSNELFIEFIFKAGPQDNTYMATVKGRRNSKRFSDVPTLKRDAYAWVDEAWKPIEVDNWKRSSV